MKRLEGIRSGVLRLSLVTKPVIFCSLLIAVLLTSVLNQYSWGQCEGCTDDLLTIQNDKWQDVLEWNTGENGKLVNKSWGNCPLWARHGEG